ncbi:sodium/hydrogen exchanger [Caballeronia temeraria]|uniref:Sodium/hydrogen exchanger n=1 Tax=Caballeronia temeraria TaxID=1777137 RepID=A0A158DPP9_9BURK|nr:hypothetical protein [Caballeronia temeraria]SAK96463.1 sodium/hydrogen exchanger [Caballeronia temeraria]
MLIVGVLLVLMAVGRKNVERLPITGAMLYLVVGFVLGPASIGLLMIDLESHIRLLRTLTEVGLATGPALLLASTLGPTDPVLANELRVK